jgi:hypothetical protein
MTERKPQVLLKHYLKKLKLPTLLREYEAVAAERLIRLSEELHRDSKLLRSGPN